MKQIKILLIDGSSLGQPESVLRLWRNAFELRWKQRQWVLKFVGA